MQTLSLGMLYPEAERALGLITDEATTKLGDVAVQLLGPPPVQLLGLGADDYDSTVGTVKKIALGGVLGVAAVSLLSAGVSAVHGYKSTGRASSAFGWGMLGFLFPVVTPLVAVAQGYGEPRR